MLASWRMMDSKF